jgi:macrolide transport system ATP-binding/permease protein
MAEAPNRRSAGSRIFRSLLRLLPFDFRVEHGREMEQVIARSARLAIPGAVVGIALAATIAWSLRTLLMGVSPFDPATYGFTTLVLLLVSLLASFVPARRAATASPLDALRAD